MAYSQPEGTPSPRALVVEIVIDRSPSEVWADVRDVGSHVDWMHDAVAIRFLSDEREGIGTRFECDTKVGPIRLTDIMEITSWDEGQLMGVRHVGLVEGIGEFTLEEISPGRTRFSWAEDLTFPWYFGGPVAGVFARPVLRLIWKRNLRHLKARVEARLT